MYLYAGLFCITISSLFCLISMKVVSPTSASHNITLVPRFSGAVGVGLFLRNETTNITTDLTNVYSEADGKATVSFDFTFLDADKFQMTIKDGVDIVFLGKIIATDQTPQEYKLTEGYYTYEP